MRNTDQYYAIKKEFIVTTTHKLGAQSKLVRTGGTTITLGTLKPSDLCFWARMQSQGSTQLPLAHYPTMHIFLSRPVRAVFLHSSPQWAGLSAWTWGLQCLPTVGQGKAGWRSYWVLVRSVRRPTNSSFCLHWYTLQLGHITKTKVGDGGQTDLTDTRQ